MKPSLGAGLALGGGRSPWPGLPGTRALWRMDGALPGITDATGRGNNLSRYLKPAVSTAPFRLGATQRASQMLDGRLAKWGNWKRLLTSAEKAALRAGEAWPFDTTPSLRDASAFYLLNEVSNSATYADATGRGNDLARGANPITRVAGPLGGDYAARFGASGESVLTLNPPTADVTNGNVAHTISGWAYIDAFGPAQQVFWGQANTDDDNFGNCIYYFSSNDRLQSDFAGTDILRNPVIVADNAGAPGTGTWHHCLFFYDPITNTETLEIDGVANSLSEVQQPAPRTSPNRLHFGDPPAFNVTHHSGWDAIGAACHAFRPGGADLSFATGQSKAVWGWFRLDNTGVTQTLAGFLDITSSVVTNWAIQYGTNQVYFLVGDSAGGFDYINAGVSDTAWHCFVCWYDATQGKIFLNLDNGAATPAGVAVTHAITPGAIDFRMGACVRASAASGFDQQFMGDLGLLGISDGVPSASDIASVWAYGAGRFR